jgi:glutathione S-transferase
MKLYNSEFSPPCRRVRAVAHELGIQLELLPIDFKALDHKKPTYLAQNPNGKVPLLIDGDYHLWESNAIICYLAELHPDKGLIPLNPRGRAEVNKWLFWQTAHLAPPLSKLNYEKTFKPRQGKGEADPKIVAECMDEFHRFAKVFEQALSGQEYVIGLLSVVDFSLASTLANRTPLGIEYSAYPNIAAWLTRIEARDSWKKSAQSS